MKLNAPCKDCEKRVVNCHSKCKDYIQYKEESAELKQIITKAQIADADLERGKKAAFLKYLKTRRKY